MRASRNRTPARPGLLLLGALVLTACRSRPEPENPFHAGEAKLGTVQRQQLQQLQPPTRMADGLIVAPPGCHGSFGEAIAVGSGLIVIGAPQADGGGRVWVHDAAHLDAEPVLLQPGSDSTHQRFGASVAVSPSGAWIAVGAPNAEVDGQRHAGRVYLFHRDQDAWVLERTFTDPDADTANERLGAAVAMDDDYLLAGAPEASMQIAETKLVPDVRRPAPPRPGQPEKPPPSGEPREVERVTQIFMREGALLAWKRESDGSWSGPSVSILARGREGACFGSTIALRGNQAVVGAPSQRTKYGEEGGTISIFVRRTGMPWRREPNAIIAPSTAEALDYFGSSVATAPGLVVAGLPNANLRLAPDAGRVAVYRQNVESRVWIEEPWSQGDADPRPLIESPAPETGSDFGQSVGISRRQLIVGQPNSARGANSGRVFTFEKRDPPTGSGRATWQSAEEWLAPPFAHVQRFGFCMDATDEMVAIAAPGSERVPGCVVLFRQAEPSSDAAQDDSGAKAGTKADDAGSPASKPAEDAAKPGDSKAATPPNKPASPASAPPGKNS